MSIAIPTSIPLSELPRSVRVPAVASRLVLLLTYWGLIGYGTFAVVYNLAQDGFALASVLPMAGAMVLSAVLGYLFVVVIRGYLPAERRSLASSRMGFGLALIAAFVYPLVELEAFFSGAADAAALSCFGAVVASLLLAALSQFLLERSEAAPLTEG